MSQYQLRGNRVAPISANEIRAQALAIAHKFKFNKRNRKRCDKMFEQLSDYAVTLDVMSDSDWNQGLTKGHFDHTSLTITVPQAIYNDACMGDRDALFVMLHELGHLFLGHRPLLHSAPYPPTEIEDAEWQADMFALFILEKMGYTNNQMTFDFYL